MNWDNSRLLDALCYDLVLSDWPRGQNRARIQKLANGGAPYSQTEVEENGIAVNVSDLTHTRLCHDARTQFYNGFLKTGYFARVKLDSGPKYKRDIWAAIVTNEWNKRLKASISYFEALRAKFGTLVLHGISPAVWENDDKWCPKPLGVEDVLIPGETLLGFDNLPFYVVRRTFTGVELLRLTSAAKRDPGWNMPFVERLIAWMEQQATQLRALNWPDVWSPEKIEERTKEEAGGTLAGDRAPKIDVFDIYAYDDKDGDEGWIRRMILDSWSEPAVPTAETDQIKRFTDIRGDTNGFLFSSGNRKVGQSWQNLISFNYADLSATFPARYHSVRSLGWMTYASCHMGNRLRCKFYEAVLEALMMLYEVDSQTDAQNALKVNLINKGFIDKTIKPVKAADRWQVNSNLVELGLRDNANVIMQQSSSWVQNQNYSQDRLEKTRFQVMAELQATTSLAGVAFNQAYQYQSFEFKEIFRRYCRKNSTDPDVRKFRARCLSQDVPEEYLNDAERWEVESERVLGAGNKTLEMTIAQQLMEWRPMFDPEPQRDVLRRGILAISDDPALALRLVPEQPVEITRGVREAEHIAGTLLAGVDVEPMEGENHIEIIETLLKILGTRVQAAQQGGGMMEGRELGGCIEIAKHLSQRIDMIAEDKQQAQRVKQYQSALTKLGNELKAFGQRLQAQMQKQAQAGAEAGAGGNGKDMAKIQAIMMQAQTDDRIRTKSAAERTAQRKIQFEQKLTQDRQRHAAELQAMQEKHQVEIAKQAREHVANLAATEREAESKLRRNRMTSVEEGEE